MSNTRENNTCLFWHRRDLRLHDNHGLYEACRSSTEVIPVFIFDTTILASLPANDHRVTFIYDSLKQLAADYKQHGNALEVYIGDPQQLIPELAKRYSASAVFTNRDYEPNALKRDASVREKLLFEGIAFNDFKDQVIFETTEVLKDDGSPYTVYTPYKNKWMHHLSENVLTPFPSENLIAPRITAAVPIPELADFGFVRNDRIAHPDRKIPVSIITNYHRTRDIPSVLGTTRLSIHLRFGTLSIRKLAAIALKTNEKYLNELIWRDFYAMILFHFPKSVDQAFKTNYSLIRWENDTTLFHAWCEGKTGFPMVDAGMRELNETGFMHNRVRMITASFLCKHLLIDWRWGERYFAEKLSDFDLASNVGGWQWAASTGCDAVPYFRIFNPTSQQEKFDPEYLYIKKWIPEWGTSSYPQPIVEHSMARNRAIERYKEALNAYK